MLDSNVMMRTKSQLLSETLAGFGPRLITHPVIGEVVRQFRTEFLQRLQSGGYNKTVQTTQML